MTGQKKPYCYRLGTAGQYYDWVYLFQTNKPIVGEARQAENFGVRVTGQSNPATRDGIISLLGTANRHYMRTALIIIIGSSADTPREGNAKKSPVLSRWLSRPPHATGK